MESEGFVLNKPHKEKRERQPNWTEAEKQLLLSLTRIHKCILENKGSDSITIKRKSDAWDQIASNMRERGYHRTKERLKQQLGRIRAAEAKKIKDALAKELTTDLNCSLQYNNTTNNHHTAYHQRHHSLDYNPQLAKDVSAAALMMLALKERECIGEKHDLMPAPIENGLQIKIEKVEVLCPKDQQTDSSSLSPTPSVEVEEAVVSPPSNLHAVLIENNVDSSAVKRSLAFSTSAEHMEQPSTSSTPAVAIDENGRHSLRRCTRNIKKSHKRKMCIRVNGGRSRFEQIRQIYLYRMAVEKERLRGIRLQQRRDLLLYRKDMQIQNLKLQILRNLANNQARANHINL